MIIEIKGVIVPDNEEWIYDLFGMQAISPSVIAEQLTSANGEDITVLINSDGGEIFAGSEIYEMFRTYQGNLTIKVVGLAASAASVVACARQSEIAPTGMLMIHNVFGGAEGDYHTMDKTSEVLKKANKAQANAYASKTGKPMDELLRLMDEETWITADEAVELGFIDSISKAADNKVYKLAAARYDSGLLPREVIHKYQNQKAAKKAQASLELLNLKNSRRS